ncbi:MAG: hypothetical protein JWL90_1555 [Chthoniobacteraceae bacterium]|nr:hypothetical protein [Chthoniobacteraceae bacterium]
MALHYFIEDGRAFCRIALQARNRMVAEFATNWRRLKELRSECIGFKALSDGRRFSDEA